MAKENSITISLEYLNWIFDWDYFRNGDGKLEFFRMLVEGVDPLAKRCPTLGALRDLCNFLPERFIIKGKSLVKDFIGKDGEICLEDIKDEIANIRIYFN